MVASPALIALELSAIVQPVRVALATRTARGASWVIKSIFNL